MTAQAPQKSPTLIVLSIALVIALVVIAVAIFSDGDHYELEIPLADIHVDKPYYADWHGQQVLVVQPNASLLADQVDSSVYKSKDVVDPPERTGRDTFNYKVFVFDRNQGYLMFGYQKWYNAIVPCASFHYINQAFMNEDKVVQGGFKCSQSLDEFWQDKLVFNLFGRAQNREVPDMYVPYYRIVDDKLIVGLK
ncbi:hypothetical protein R50072_01180 [Simiduia litorea]|uniref:hypothetical protein n=1 Tax=Simiduia litorea TaxID=1435348 RepID=UPI0036F3B5BC